MDESCGCVGSTHFSNFCFLSDLRYKKMINFFIQDYSYTLAEV